MMRRAILFAVAFSVLLFGTGWDAWLGHDLCKNCKKFGAETKATDAMSTFIAGGCVGYVTGVAGALEGSTICLGSNVEPQQLVDVIKRWLEEHPELRHYAASSLVTEALKE